MKNRYKCFLRSTSNTDSKTGQLQIALPPKLRRRMGWKLNENLTLSIARTALIPHIETNCIIISKDEANYDIGGNKT